MAEGSGPNGSKQCQNAISPSFPPQSNFDVLLLFPNILTVTHFGPDFALHSGDKTATCTAFNSGRISSPASIEVSEVFFIASMCDL
jgi:hypothetical protein